MAGHGQVGRPLRMGVEHRADLGPRPIHLGMDREFERRLDVPAIDRLPVEIDRDDVLHGQRGAHRGAGIDVERVGVAPHTAMAVVIDVFGMLQHANGVHKFLLDLVLRRLCHDVSSCELRIYFITRCFHKSQERPTVLTLTTSAIRPSSASSAASGPPSASAWCWMLALVTVKIARNTATGKLPPTATMPWARNSATGLSASTCARAAPLAAVLITMSVVPNFSRMSNTGTPAARNAALWYIARIGVFDSPKAITDGEWLCATATTSGRARRISPCR